MLGKFYRPPFIGIIAFVTVIMAQPLGHSLFVMLKTLFGSADGMSFSASFLCGLVGFAMVWVGLKKKETAATWLGFIGAILIWTGWFEFTWEFFAHLLNVQPIVNEVTGALVMGPGLQIIQASGILMFATTLLLYFNRDTRCTAFKWIHRHGHMNPGKASPGKDRDYARITALETIFVIWFIYVVNLTLYDERILGIEHPVTYATFFGFLIWAVYLNTRLIKYARMAPAVRYAIPTTIITWLDIEVLSRWGILDEFWLKPAEYALEMGLVVAAFVIAGIAIYLTPERGEETV
ncbi:MAG: hypothetical protein P8L79_03295 [Rhodospirillaceae bacterium]|jgi:hypothetical protein|nr:hypothetical protein [Rhodospirillaceae bacterium]